MHETLIKMRSWIDAEIEKSKQPRQEKFKLMSLSFCVERVVSDPVEIQATLTFLHSVALAEEVRTRDVIGPYGAIFLIDRALKSAS